MQDGNLSVLDERSGFFFHKRALNTELFSRSFAFYLKAFVNKR